MVKKIPPFPIPADTGRKLAKKFLPVAKPLSKMFTLLKPQLKQAGYSIGKEEYVSLSILTALLTFVFVSVMAFSLGIILQLENLILLTFFSAFIISLLNFLYILNYPKLLVIKKIRSIEMNLIIGLKNMYVEVKSGIPLFDSMVTMSRENYGQLSNEMKEIVKRINTGTSVEEVLDEVASENPSSHFRRAMWQISNSMKSGVSISKTLKSIINDLTKEKIILIRKYGSQLNPLTMVYMMVAVIAPALGITMLIILSSFSGTHINEAVFWIILFGVGTFQFIYLGIIKSRRPNI